ncbi:hypothetical protein EF847_06255 [Actinobacteria bacterium YIM 96077]|uniref:DUF1795 domain-containing protein n=1 Tax=Phytoactinopolyspora halophila TaxID=1981511 RepID=A0A329QFY1_9ACTN|nr:hypothetical protein [Phytoactinopolyspora halophila]AYY12367.1 hypothetical protein EF847_06255 [Actinobacteria bacterium YIM 96077]RAW09218.1 hypothetical protein DPM12_22260 [Phytoactinopolyspora halophila]
MSSDDLGEWYDPRAFREASDWKSTGIPAIGLEVLVPDGWWVHTDPEAPAIITMICPPGDRPGDFHPTIALTVEHPPDGLSGIREYTRELVAGIRATLTDAHVLAIDPLWVGGFEGRRVVTGYRDGTYTLVAQQYWAIADTGVATVFTGTSSLEQYLWASDIFAHSAAGLTLASSLVRDGEAV